MSAPDRSGNVVDLARARTRLRLRVCGHCGAAMAEGEREEDCSSAGFGALLPVPVRAAGKE